MTNSKENTYTVLIIGSGFGGQASAVNLIKNGITDFCILERRSFMGGTWCQNTYPGAAVDVQSPLYSFSFEPYQWTEMYANQNELEKYTNHVIEKYKLREKTHTETNVIGMKWLNEEKKWELTTSKKNYFAQFVINASGPLSNPVIPNFKGKELFKGKSFHTNNWDHSYDYKNKRVAIIGSGASAAQVIPAIANSVKELHVFQRTPHWVLPRSDRKFNSIERKLLRVNFLYQLLRKSIYWSLETRVIGFKYSPFLLKFIAQRKAKSYLKRVIADEVLRKKVTPNFTIGCKRILLSNSLYSAYCQGNVKLYDASQSILELKENSILTKENFELNVDLIIYSTGYDVTGNAIAFNVTGKNNYSLKTFWNEFPRAYLGTTVPEFPNFFIVTGPNTGIGHTSAIFIIESQLLYIIQCIKKVIDNNKKSIEVKVVAEEKYTLMIHKEMKKTVWKSGGCKSWYQNEKGFVTAMFPGFSFTYRNMAKKFKTEDHIVI